MKKLLSILLALGTLTAMLGCRNKPAVTEGEKDGVRVTLENVSYKKMNARDTLVLMDVTVDNGTKKDLSEVFFAADYLDEKGNLIASGLHFYSEDEAVPAGGSAKKEESRFVMEFGGKTPSSVNVRVTSVKTTEERPLMHVPEQGEYLYQAMSDEKLANIRKEPPKEMEIGIDQMGYLRTAVFTAEDGLEEAVNLFTEIKIGSPDAPDVTDNYNYILFTWKDGSKSIIHIDLNVLTCEINGRYRTYDLENLGPLFALAYDRFEE